MPEWAKGIDFTKEPDFEGDFVLVDLVGNSVIARDCKVYLTDGEWPDWAAPLKVDD